jgi:hypothetical protein
MAPEKKMLYSGTHKKKRRPRETWRRSVNKELGRVDKTWHEARRIVTERTECNMLVAALCSNWELGEKMENGIPI